MPHALILMRHAKSAWNNPGLDDFDRPLNARGRASAPAIGNWLAEHGHVPSHVLVSGARRTVETWDRMSPAFPEHPAMESVPALYLASAETIFNVLRTQQAKAILVICHNPGIAEFAERIVKKAPEDDRFHRYPTAATTVIEFDIASWEDLAWATGTPVAFTVPRDLAD